MITVVNSGICIKGVCEGVKLSGQFEFMAFSLIRFTYVVLKKGQILDSERMPRLVDKVMKNSSTCMQCNICYPDGRVRRTNVYQRTTKYVTLYITFVVNFI